MANMSLEPWNDLNGKIVLVTGASSGLGREFCLNLALAGCKVIAAARRTNRLRSLCDEINALNKDETQAVAIELDISAKGPIVDLAAQKAWDAFGRIDALVNNAGIRGTIHSALEVPEDEWNNVMNTNITGTWSISKSIAKRMCDAKIKGSIINISSITGTERGHLPGGLAYAVSKAGVNSMTKVMGLELGICKIRVNSISPGIFKSEITEGLIQKSWLNRVVEKTVPLKTFGTTDPALTSLVRYLIHDSAEYVTGNVFIVDAGATLPGVPLFSCL